jgi:hypothetical protein
MDCARDERIIGENYRPPAHCHAKSKMGTVGHDVARFTKCIAECNFDCRKVRVYLLEPRASPEFS